MKGKIVSGIVLMLLLTSVISSAFVIQPAKAETGLTAGFWPMFGHDLGHTGQSPYLGPQSLDQKWSYAAQDSNPGYRGLVIGSDGTVYVAGWGRFSALRPDGTLKWTFGYWGPGGPSIASDGVIYLNGQNELYAINPDGTLKWTHYFGGYVSLYTSSVSIAPDGTIYVGSVQSVIYAFAPDGTMKWSYDCGIGNPYYHVPPHPAIASDGSIYISSQDGRLYALDPDGGLKWRSSLDPTINPIRGIPLIGADGTIYVSSNMYFDSTTLYAFSSSGALRWTYAGTSIHPVAIASDGTIYVTVRGEIRALSNEGNLKWRYSIGSVFQPCYYQLASIGSDGTIYFGGETLNSHRFFALAHDGASLKWYYDISDFIYSPSIGSDGTIYVGSQDRKIYAFSSPAPPPCGRPVLVTGLEISPTGPYCVGDTLTATFSVQNQGNAAIALDKLLLGGRFNGGTLPNGLFPDFAFQSVILQPNEQHEYSGTLSLTEAGNYHFFVAYYIQNPSAEERKLLDENNWNTCIDLGAGMTDSDRVRDTTCGTDWSFAVITDLHIGRGYQNYNKEDYYLTVRLQKVVDRIKELALTEPIRFVVVLGDITEDGTQAEMQKARDILNGLGNIPYFPVIGNHDVNRDIGELWFDSYFDSLFFNAQCDKLRATWINGGTTIPASTFGNTIYLQNYAFQYKGMNFVFLDAVDRSFPYAPAKLWRDTYEFLGTQLSNGANATLFSHHPMIENLGAAFSSGEMNDIESLILAAEDNFGVKTLANFVGHIHGYFDPAKLLFDELTFSNKKEALSALSGIGEFMVTPVFFNANGDYRDEGFATPANIPVISTEAMMVASNEPSEELLH